MGKVRVGAAIGAAAGAVRGAVQAGRSQAQHEEVTDPFVLDRSPPRFPIS
jgi:hypothetical protein